MTAVSSAQDRRLLADAVRQCALGRGGVRGFLATDDTPSSIDLELWTQLGAQMGVAGLLVPEHLGGAGASMADAGAVLVELGATLAPVPALATVGMATPLLRLCPPGPAVDELLRTIAGGELVVAVAWPAPGSASGPAEGADLPVTATDLGDGRVTVSGRATFVIDGTIADVLLVAATDATGMKLLAVDMRAAGASRSPMTTLDLTRGLADVVLDEAAATVVADGAAAEAALGSGRDLALVAVAAEQVGLASRCLDAAVDYARQRVQFDRPIGSFQSIKHKLVDLLLKIELARSAFDLAVTAADELLLDPAPQRTVALRAAASMAKAMCSETATVVTAETLHVFGGIGFTWEHDAHLYFRRAKSLEVLLGAPAAHRRRLAAALGVTS